MMASRYREGLETMRNLVEYLQVLYVATCVGLAVAYCGIIAGAF